MKLIKKYTIPILLILISIFTFYRLMRPGYFSMQDDMQVFRLQQFDKCIQDFQIPCRYVPDAGLGYGYPLYNYYSPLPYAFAEFFHLIGFSFINSIKIVFSLSHIIGIIGMYLFASIYWGKVGGLVSAVFFLLAPYQAVDSYVRGAIAESLALNIIPLVFWSLTLLIKEKSHKLFFVLSLAALLLCHNLTALTFFPIIAIYSLIILWQNNKFKIGEIIKLFVSAAISVGISSFFLLPVIFEKNLVTVDTMTQGYFYYVIHFATINELFFSRFWGYGASLWGPKDDMSFQIGLLQWIIPLIVLSTFAVKKYYKKYSQHFTLIILFFLAFIFSAFLTHSKSTPIWQILPFMPYYQFPWRFLTAIIFSLSFISGGIIFFFDNTKIKNTLAALLVISAIVLNVNYFKEDIWYQNQLDQDKLTAAEITRQSGAGLMDYWPKTGNSLPNKFSDNQPQSKSQITVEQFNKTSNSVTSIISTTENAEIIMPVVYFPNWKLYVNGQQTKFTTTSDLGLIQFSLAPGKHQIDLKFTNTPIRTVSNIISIFSLILAIIIFRPRKRINE